MRSDLESKKIKKDTQLDTFHLDFVRGHIRLKSAVKFSLLILGVTLTLTYSIKKIQNLSFYELLADPSEVAGISPLVGFFTQIGLFKWAIAAGICLFASSFSDKPNSGKSTWQLFLYSSAILSMILLFDDAFQIHETYYYPFVNEDNMSKTIKNLFELACFGVYAFLVSFYVIRFRNLCKRTNYKVLISAIICFALSIFVDICLPDRVISNLIEESLKFLGISMWLFYLSDVGRRYIYRVLLS